MSEAVSGEVWGRVGMCRVVEVSAFLKNYFPIALLGNSLREMKIYFHTKTCTQRCLEALITVT
jgi:hypothetical protein